MVDLSAIAKWPNVPACYGWLSLDRRGDWRLQGERITHGGLIAFINRQYAVDASGRWFLQNGPQRVFVSLAYTPWVFRYDGKELLSHTSQPGGPARSVWLDDAGSILLDTALGVGLLDDRDLARLLGECRDADGKIAEESAFVALLQGLTAPINWHGIPLRTIAANEVAMRFGFDPQPHP